MTGATTTWAGPPFCPVNSDACVKEGPSAVGASTCARYLSDRIAADCSTAQRGGRDGLSWRKNSRDPRIPSDFPQFFGSLRTAAHFLLIDGKYRFSRLNGEFRFSAARPDRTSYFLVTRDG